MLLVSQTSAYPKVDNLLISAAWFFSSLAFCLSQGQTSGQSQAQRQSWENVRAEPACIEIGNNATENREGLTNEIIELSSRKEKKKTLPSEKERLSKRVEVKRSSREEGDNATWNRTVLGKQQQMMMDGALRPAVSLGAIFAPLGASSASTRPAGCSCFQAGCVHVSKWNHQFERRDKKVFSDFFSKIRFYFS